MTAQGKVPIAPICSRTGTYDGNRPEHKEDGKAPVKEGTEERVRGDRAGTACPMSAFPVPPRPESSATRRSCMVWPSMRPVRMVSFSTACKGPTPMFFYKDEELSHCSLGADAV